jgi:hypothetical protein
MSTAVLLRTLTEKSILKFGRYNDLTVNEIMGSLRTKGKIYLTWVYYNCSNISFHEDVLSTLGITDDIKIPKPGNVTKQEYGLLKVKTIQNRIAWEDENLTDEERELQRLQNAGQTRAIKATQIRSTRKTSGRFVKKAHLMDLNRGKCIY